MSGDNKDRNDLLICMLSFIPLRLSPSHKSEMVSQVLFGERFFITDSEGSWLKIQTLFDDYSGWIDGDHGGYDRFNGGEGIVLPAEMRCMRSDGSTILLAPASELYNLSDDFNHFVNGSSEFFLPDGTSELFKTGPSPADSAVSFLNAPYLWGGRTPYGVDCSGLVQAVYKIHGIALPRDASQQSSLGEPISFLADAIPGDLLFFSDTNNRITHTGILARQGMVIHSSGKVMIERVDHQGIWSEASNRYTHRLRLIKRVMI